jgi:hypothetical protein
LYSEIINYKLRNKDEFMVLLPHKRSEMMHYLRALADTDYQRRAWVRGEAYPEIGQDCFGYALTFFFDDTMLAEAPERNIGTILYSAQEVASLRNLTDMLVNLLNQLGDDCTDLEYISSPYWRAVVAAAQEAVNACVPDEASV